MGLRQLNMLWQEFTLSTRGSEVAETATVRVVERPCVMLLYAMLHLAGVREVAENGEC